MHPAPSDTLAPDTLPNGRRGRRAWLPFLLGAAVMAAVLLSAYEAAGLAARKDSRGLGLTATFHEGQVYLSWDPYAKPIPAAEVAVLSITDAGRHEAVMLNLDALRMAKLAYRPIGTDVTFDLTVNDPEGGAAVTQSVRVIIRGAPEEPDWTIRPVRPEQPPVPV